MDHVRAAKTRLCELRNMQQELIKTQVPDGTWEWFLQIEMMDLMTFILLEKNKEKDRLAGQPLKKLSTYILPFWMRSRKGKIA